MAPRRSRRRAADAHRAGRAGASPDIKDERTGPKVGAPEQAIAGFFVRRVVVDRSGQVQADKTATLRRVIEKAGRPAIEVIAEIVPEGVKAFPARSRCAGARRRRSGQPELGAAAALHRRDVWTGDRGADSSVEVGASRRATRRTAIASCACADQVEALRRLRVEAQRRQVVLDPARRMDMIRTDAKNLAFRARFRTDRGRGRCPRPRPGRWPVVLMAASTRRS